MAQIGDQWESVFQAKYIEWLQLSPTRHLWEFSAELNPLARLEALSRHWPMLTVLLDFDDERRRVKGMAKARGGTVEHHQFRY